MITVLTAAQTTELTTLARVKAALRLTTDDASRDQNLCLYITEASSAIETTIGRVLRRERIQERVAGTGRTTLVAGRYPVAELEAVAHDDLGDQEIGDSLRVSDAETGILWRATGWPQDLPITVGLTVDEQQQLGRQPWLLTMKTGYLLPGDAIAASGFDVATDGTLTRTGGTMPLVAPGDVIRLSGFNGAGNNGRFPVLARTDTTIRVSAALTAETSGPDAYIEARTLPAELERLAIEAVKAWYLSEGRDPAVTSERLGDWSASYSRSSSMRQSGTVIGLLPDHVLTALERWTVQA